MAITVGAATGLLLNDTDAEHDALNVAAVNGVAGNLGAAVTGTNGGSFTLNPNGSYTFDPGHDFDGLAPGATATTSVMYTVSDGHGGTSTSTLTISVDYANLPPIVALPVPAQNSLDGTLISIPVVGVFTDPNPGDVLTITASGLPPSLAYNPATGAIEGTLTANASQHTGPYVVTLTANDGHGGTVTSNFNFTVGNPAPVATNDVNTVLEHGTTAGDVRTNDHDGGSDSDPLAVTQINGAAYTPGTPITLLSGAMLTMAANGTYGYDPNGAFNGLGVGQTATDTFTYQVSDGQNGTAIATVIITITGQNDAPVVVDPAHPGTPPTDPLHVVPTQTASDGTAIAPVNVSSFFKDPDTGDTLALSVNPAQLPPGVTFNAATGTFSGTPTAAASQGGPNGDGVYPIVVTANDGHGGTVTTIVTFQIGNPPPVATLDTNSVAEHGTTTGNVLTNDHDGGGDTDPLAVTQVNGAPIVPGATITLPSGALLTMNANGSYVYDPHGTLVALQVGQTATDTFTYQISDGQAGVSTATVTITINGQNDAPSATADTKLVQPRTSVTVAAPLGVLSNDTDPEHDPLAVTSITNGATTVAAGAAITGSNGGTFTINADGSYTFNAGNDFDSLPPGPPATTSVTYTVDDGHGGTASTTLTITVPYANLPPIVAQPVPAQSTLDGNTIAIDVTNVFSDPNPGDKLSIVASGLPAGLTYNPATHQIEGTVAANASQHAGPYTVTLTATDLGGSSVSTTFQIGVTNPPPVAQNDINTVAEHGTTTGASLANDHDGASDKDPLAVTQVNGAAITSGGTITLPSGALLVMNANGTYSYDPHGAFNGIGLGQSASDSFSYQISDGNGGFATATVDITITGQNDAPVVVDPAHPGTPPTDPLHVVPTQTASDGTAIAPVNVSSFFKDPDTGDTLALSVNPAQLPPGVTFNAATGTFSGTPTAAASQGGPNGDGVYPIVVTANDGHGGTVTTIVTFQIGNPPPVATLDTNSVAEHGTTTGNVLTNDHDGGGDTDPLAVTQVNGAPIVPGATITLPSGALLTMNANGSYVYDPHGAFAGLAAGQSASDTFSYQVADGQGGFATANVAITVNGENDPPVVVDPTHPSTPPADPLHVIPVQSATDGTAITPVKITSFFKDPDATDTLTVTVNLAQLPPGVSFDPTTGTFTGTPTSNASQGGPAGNGVYPVVITASDGHGGTVSTIITFKIADTPPVAVNDTGIVNEHGPSVPGNVLTNDHDGGGDTDPLTVTQVNGSPAAVGQQITLPSGALLRLNTNGTYTYDPNGAFIGLSVGQTGHDTFTYQVSDGQGGFATATVTLNVVGQNDSPFIVDPAHPGTLPTDPNHVVPALSGKDGTAIAPLDIRSFVHDPDAGDTLTFSVPPGSLPPGITFNPATGIFSGTPTSNASQGGPTGNGVYPIVITISDGHGGVVSTTVTMTFVNPPPVAVDDRVVGQPDEPLVINVLGNDHDDDSLTVVAAKSNSGTVSINPNGTLAFEPAPNFTGLAVIEYTISDGQGGFSTARAFVLISPNIHVISDANPPDVALGVLPAAGDPGLATDGIIVETVQNAGALGSVGGSLGQSGIVDAAANQVSSLGGLGNKASGSGVAGHIEITPVSRPWQLETLTDVQSAHVDHTWDPKGLTGFSLRFTYDQSISDGARAEIAFESFVRDGTLILQLSSTALSGRANVVEYRVLQADGRSLPNWLDRAGPDVLIGQRPAGNETINLKVIAILSDGTNIERDVTVQTISGEIQPLKSERRSDVMPMFTDQLQTQLTRGLLELEQLERALAE